MYTVILKIPSYTIYIDENQYYIFVFRSFCFFLLLYICHGLLVSLLLFEKSLILKIYIYIRNIKFTYLEKKIGCTKLCNMAHRDKISLHSYFSSKYIIMKSLYLTHWLCSQTLQTGIVPVPFRGKLVENTENYFHPFTQKQLKLS